MILWERLKGRSKNSDENLTAHERFILSLGPRNYLLFCVGVTDEGEDSPAGSHYADQIERIRLKAKFHLEKLIQRGQITHEEADIFLRELLSVNVMSVSSLKKRVEKKMLIMSEEIYKISKIRKEFAELKRKYLLLLDSARNSGLLPGEFHG